jgi:3-(3-hydroxy-phenyl)propionate hydroxylase
VSDYDVVVIGGGPVGEMMLALLGLRGIRAVAFEKAAEVWDKPRAVHFDGEILRVFQSIGIGDEVLARCEPMLRNRLENEAGEVIFDHETGALGDQGWVDDVMFHQPEIDAMLRSRVERFPSVSLETGMEVTRIDQSETEVTVHVRDADGTSGRSRQVTARYVVGCDGASSFVRKAIGSTLENLGPDNPWLVTDGLLVGESPIEGTMVLFGHYSRPQIWCMTPGGRARMEFKVLPDDNRDEIVTPEAIERMTRGLLTPQNYLLERTSIYTFSSAIADRWRSGRIFVAGDAAHLMPPLFGQGLCSGIRDVCNLAWKLDLALEGADDSLLDTYQTERSAHVRAWITQATGLSEFVQTVDPEVAARRDAFVKANPEATRPTVPPLGHGLHGDAAAPAGARSIQPQVRSGRFDDGLGTGFVVAARAKVLAQLDPSLAALLEASSWFEVRDETSDGVATLLDAYDCNAVILRPDRHILGVADSADDLEALLEVIRPLALSVAESR